VRRWISLLAAFALPASSRAQEAPGDPPPARIAVGPPIESEARGTGVPAAARLRGTVLFDHTDARVPGFFLRLFGRGLRAERWTPGDAGGFEVSIAGGTGRFEWAVVAPGYDPVRGMVDLRGGESATVGVVRLVRGSAVLEGRVTDLLGRPVAGARAVLHGEIVPAPEFGTRNGRDQTDESGTFRIQGVPAGSGFLELVAPGLPPVAAVPVETHPGGTYWFDLSPTVGTLTLRLPVPAGEWKEPFWLTLVDETQEVEISWRIRPPGEGAGDTEEAPFWGIPVG
jgi:hypothetical protein